MQYGVCLVEGWDEAAAAGLPHLFARFARQAALPCGRVVSLRYQELADVHWLWATCLVSLLAARVSLARYVARV